MDHEHRKEETIKDPVINTKVPNDNASEVAGSMIHIDPEKEAAALRKFDLYLLPVSVVFLVLSALDRNNVSKVVFMEIVWVDCR
jgi:hypothetical protein